jgi:simple sugar transport system permease protein
MTSEVQLEAEATGGVEARRRRFAGRRWREHLGLTLALLALLCFLTLTAPNFLTATNLTNVMHQVAYVGIIAWAMTLVILAGEIDISVGSAAAFAGVLLALLLQTRVPAALAVAGTLLIGTSIGLLAGSIRAAFLIPSFIVTLALYEALRGLGLLLTNAIPQAPETLHNRAFTFLGSGDLGGIPVAAVILIVLFAIFWFVSTRTTFGKSVYAIGGNAEAARLAGIRVARIRTVLFGLTGLMAALSGVLLAASLGAGDPETSVGLEFDAIAAVIVGGTNLFGGSGSLVGTAIGVVFIGILGNGLVLLGVNPYATTVVRGAVILVAVLVTSPGLRDRLQDLGREARRLTAGAKSERSSKGR